MCRRVEGIVKNGLGKPQENNIHQWKQDRTGIVMISSCHFMELGIQQYWLVSIAAGSAVTKPEVG